MMVLCCELGLGSVSSSSIYCDTLSVSQYDSKVRSDLTSWAPQGPHGKSLNNLFDLNIDEFERCMTCCSERRAAQSTACS